MPNNPDWPGVILNDEEGRLAEFRSEQALRSFEESVADSAVKNYLKANPPLTAWQGFLRVLMLLLLAGVAVTVAYWVGLIVWRVALRW